MSYLAAGSMPPGRRSFSSTRTASWWGLTRGSPHAGMTWFPGYRVSVAGWTSYPVMSQSASPIAMRNAFLAILSKDFLAPLPLGQFEGYPMQFGIFYEHQLPR